MLQFRIYSVAHLNEKPAITVHNTRTIPLKPAFWSLVILKILVILKLLVILLTANKEEHEFPRCQRTK